MNIVMFFAYLGLTAVCIYGIFGADFNKACYAIDSSDLPV